MKKTYNFCCKNYCFKIRTTKHNNNDKNFVISSLILNGLQLTKYTNRF